MKITVKVFGPVREFIGTGQIEVLLEDGCDLSALLKALIKKYGDGLKDRILLNDAELLPYVKVLVNGKNVRDFNGLKTELKDGDEVAIVPAIVGGKY
ncbi:MAG: ubiquitin-like small modifier protein 1 [Nitrososphaerota archaeon]